MWFKNWICIPIDSIFPTDDSFLHPWILNLLDWLINIIIISYTRIYMYIYYITSNCWTSLFFILWIQTTDFSQIILQIFFCNIYCPWHLSMYLDWSWSYQCIVKERNKNDDDEHIITIIIDTMTSLMGRYLVQYN